MITENVSKVAYSVKEASEALGVNINTMYELVRQSEFPSFKIGNKFLVSVKGLEDWVSKQAAAQ
jgi:excisionase family DNA binding protein